MIGFKLRVPWSTSGKTAAQKIQAETPPGRSDEAIHEAARKQEWIALRSCHRARIGATRWLAMTARYTFTFPRRDAPELCKILLPPKTEGAGNTGCPLHPQPRAQSGGSTRVSHNRFTGTPGISCAMVLTAYFALSPVTGPVTGLCCHRHRRDAKHHRQRDASVGASGPHVYKYTESEPAESNKSQANQGLSF
jgi:hypothetical protein